MSVYGNRDDSPKEDDKMLFQINLHGRSKIFIEHMLKHTEATNKDFIIALLRYCNPVAAHLSGELG